MYDYNLCVECLLERIFIHAQHLIRHIYFQIRLPNCSHLPKDNSYSYSITVFFMDATLIR